MDALVIGPPAGLAAPLARALRRSGADVLQAVPADVDDAERAAWLLAEAAPRLVVVCEAPTYVLAQRLLGPARHVIAVDERRLAAARGDARPARSGADRALSRAALVAGGRARVVRLGRAGRRWIELGPGGTPLGPERAAAVVLLRARGAGAACGR